MSYDLDQLVHVRNVFSIIDGERRPGSGVSHSRWCAFNTPPISQSPLAASTPVHPTASISPPSNGHDSNVSTAAVGAGAGGAEHNSGGTLTPDPASQPSITGTPSAAGSSGSASGSIDSSSIEPYASCPTADPMSLGIAPPSTQHPLSSSAVCCDNGRPMMTDPMTGQTVCSCQYDPTRLALSSYARMQSAAAVAASAGVQAPPVGVYGTPYPSNEQNPYPSISVDSGPFYSSLRILCIHLLRCFVGIFVAESPAPTKIPNNITTTTTT
ncbi:unnamed protein product [Ceratitis capitata]|uniref:(Mediterranean fruit fly) hypothetical protein n=1 Tax=Ceratitis capitata TaxID=7213 RepID=A0A811UX42_CERCA|nr:unnamed protein product [Ceratitis capitata]